MKYIATVLLALLMLGCGATDDNSASTQPKTYALNYNSTLDEITGEVTFDMGNVTPGHYITLSHFTPYIEGCEIANPSTAISPSTLNFSETLTRLPAQIALQLDGACTQQTLHILADYEDRSLLDDKIITHTKSMHYTFDISKSSTLKSYTPIAQNTNLNITTNAQNEKISITVLDQYNTPATTGELHVMFPDIAKQYPVGSFSQASVKIKNGTAVFNYTAPDDIQTLLNNNINSATFRFYYDDQIANYTEVTMHFSIDTTQVVIKNYTIDFITQNDSYKMSLNETKSFSLAVVDDKGERLADSNIIDMNVSLENTSIAHLIDSHGNTGTSFNFKGTNVITMTLQSKTISGLVPIHVDVLFKDANGDTKLMNKTFNIIVESGPPTAISISYAGTSQDKEHAKFIEHFAVSVTDKYFNPVNTKPQVSVGTIVGYAKKADDGSSANTDQRIYETQQLATLEGDTLTLSSNYLADSTTVDLANDTLVTFGNGYSYPASGGWEMTNFDASHIFLTSGQYDGAKTQNLGFTIGHNYRQDACYFGEEWVGQAQLQSGATTIDESGSAIIDLSYDYYLVGKDIVVYVNIIGKDNKLNKELRIGEAKKHTLRGHGLVMDTEKTLSAENGETVVGRFYPWIKDTAEPYRNAHFNFLSVTKTGKGRILGVRYMPLDDCSRQGHAYIEYTIKADENKSFMITVNTPLIEDEF